MDLFSCNMCNATFNNRSNMNRHIKMVCMTKSNFERVNKEKNDIQSKYNELFDKHIESTNKYAELLIKYSILEKEIEYLRNDLSTYKDGYLNVCEKSFESNVQLLENTSEISKINADNVSKSISTSRFIAKHLTRAPTLKHNKEEISGYLEYCPEKKYTPVDHILFNYSAKKLNKWIGDLIVKVYKKEDPFDQAVWATDINRYSYMISEVVGTASGKRNEWITDKTGIKVTEIIIDPTLEIIKNMLIDYLQTTHYDEDDIDNYDIGELDKLVTSRQRAFEIIKLIEDEEIQKEILKYITPHLGANIILIEDQIKKKNEDKKMIKKNTNSENISNNSDDTTNTKSESSKKSHKKNTKDEKPEKIKKKDK